MNDFNLYQEEAMSFRMESADQGYALLGIAGEVGELLGYIAKAVRDDTSADLLHIKKELGDILWFVAAIADDVGLSLGSIAEGNIEKLSGRKDRGTLGGSGDER
jgi:NTP pyrophosphatase (non-canonical NTP hydrolase)